jgi:hypothetical protein
VDIIRVDPADVVGMATSWLNQIGLPGALENIAWALLLVLFGMQVVGATSVGSDRLLLEAIRRMLISGIFLSMTATVQGWTRQAFDAFYGAGTAIFQQSISPGLTVALADYTGRVGGLLGIVMGINALSQTGPLDFVGLDAVGKTFMDMFMGSMRIVLFLLGVMLALYLVLQFVAGMVIYLAQVLTPLAAVSLSHPRTEGWFGRWVSAIVHALLLALLANVLFGLAVHFGFVAPLQRQSDMAKDAIDKLWSLLKTPAILVDTQKVLDAFNALATAIVLSLLLPVATIIGLIFGVLVMWQAEARVAAFVGTVAGSLPLWFAVRRFPGPSPPRP